jgi:hypothetical protein
MKKEKRINNLGNCIEQVMILENTRVKNEGG